MIGKSLQSPAVYLQVENILDFITHTVRLDPPVWPDSDFFPCPTHKKRRPNMASKSGICMLGIGWNRHSR
jgi:hypothetical protein